MTALAELIARLEAATERSRELDAEIWAHLNGFTGAIKGRWVGGRWSWSVGSVGVWDDELPHYTTSIDAALTLVPENWWAEIHARTDTPSCVLHEFPLPCRRVPSERPYVLVAATPALALCIAALKARKAQP